MELAGQRKRSTIAVVVLGVVLITVAITLNITWVVANWRSTLLLGLGVLSFAILIGGLAMNTIYLVREIRRNEQQDAFIHAVTHELKTPVASIRLYLQTLQQREVDPQKRKEFLEIMLADSDRLQSTIDQVLLAGKTGTTRGRLNRAPVDLEEVTGECVTLARRRHHLTGDELRLAGGLPEGEEAVIHGDLDELKAAISNLIDNAIKYSDGAVDVAVSVVKLGARRVAVRVEDQGIGITSDELKRVFRRFYRIPGLSSRMKGTGLGLSIVLAVAKRHGGKAYVESEGAGKGSTFTLELPVEASGAG